MDGLAHDLANALAVHVGSVEQDNDCPSSTMNSPRQLRRQSRKRRGRKRRCDQNPLWDCGNLSGGTDSSYDGALKDYMDNMKVQEQSDSASDEMTVTQSQRLVSSLNVTSSTSNVYGESDSVTENYSIHKRPHRKKKHMRRMIVDTSEANCRQNVPGQDFLPPIRTKRRKVRKTKKNDSEGASVVCVKGSFGYNVNKIKKNSLKNNSKEDNCTSMSECQTTTDSCLVDDKSNFNSSELAPDHEDSMEDLGTPTSAGTAEVESILDSDVTMEAKDRDTEEFVDDCASTSSSSLSSSSDDEDNLPIFTNDEGREGDDEQSDFFHESGTVYGIPGIIPWWGKQVRDIDTGFESILEGCFPLMSINGQRGFREQPRE